MPSAAMIHRSILGERNNTIIPNAYLEWLDGDYVAAVFLKEMVYWSADWSQTHGKDGWFYRTDDEWNQTCWLSRKQIGRVITAINKRAGGEMIQKQVRKIRTSGGSLLQETATHYYLDTDLYEEVMMFSWSGVDPNVNTGNEPLGQSENEPKDQSLTYAPDTRTGYVHRDAPEPEIDPRKGLIAVWSKRCNEGRHPTNYGEAMKHAKTLLDAGFDAEETEMLIDWLQSQPWVHSVTLRFMVNQADAFRSSKRNGSSKATPSRNGDVPQDGTLFRKLAEELRENGL